VDAFGQERVYAPDELSHKADQYETKTLLKQNGYVDEPLDFEDAYLLGCQTLYGLGNEDLEDVFDQEREQARYQSLTALSVLHDQELYRQDGAAEQIAGVTAAIFDYDIGETIEPDVKTAMDNCGMGGDMYRTPNVSTLAALTVAADGIDMCKHGSPGNTDSTGSSDFLEHIGFDLMTDRDGTEASVEEAGFGYSEALNTDYKDIHLQTHEHADLPHMNDIIGPITNPLHPETHSSRVIGVNHLMDPETVAETYRELNERGVTSTDHLIAVRGFVKPGEDSGIDEASVMAGGSTVAELEDGEIRTYELGPEDFGLDPVAYEEIDPGEYDMSKPELGEAILRGDVETGARDIIAANAALLYHLEDGRSLEDGTERAIQILESGQAYENAKEAAAVSQGGKQ
jgi:anthranilate phosphoribosyltransferase